LNYLIELQMGFYPVAVVLQQDTTHKDTRITQETTPRSQKNTAHEAAQTTKGTLHTMNTEE
jgi:hypothetical protein